MDSLLDSTMPLSLLRHVSRSAILVFISLVLLPACSTPRTPKRSPASVNVAVAGGIEPLPLERSAKGQPETEGANGWWATRWSQDAVGFFGKGRKSFV